MSEPSAVNTSAFGEFAEAAYCVAVLDFEHYAGGADRQPDRYQRGRR